MQPLPQNNVNIPAFLTKLLKFVNDEETDHIISWSPTGTSFIVHHQGKFWYELLPLYFKHNNMSSFIRQLNMYGFHKISSVDNNTMVADKGAIQFFHEYFQRDKPELLKYIKRKVTTSRSQPTADNDVKPHFTDEEVEKMLSDVKRLETKQTSVDSQLLAMKQENAVLWRELAVFRQRHIKQQQIVNKLIQFLVTIVQPASSRMGGLGVKRHFPLMLNESPTKKAKTSPPKPPASTASEGPIIHELDTAELPEQPEPNSSCITTEMIQSPPECSTVTKAQLPKIFFEPPDLVSTVDELLSDSELQETDPLLEDDSVMNNSDEQKVFLNPTTQDTLLSNLMNGGYNINALNDMKSAVGNGKKDISAADNSKEQLAVATRDPLITLRRLNSIEDLDNHVESTQNELDQLKDLFNGCTSLDANALLGLFNDEAPPYGLSYQPDEAARAASTQVATNSDGLDPLMSGSEMARYGTSLDFSQLYDDSSDETLQLGLLQAANMDEDGSMTTPQVMIDEPNFNIKK